MKKTCCNQNGVSILPARLAVEWINYKKKKWKTLFLHNESKIEIDYLLQSSLIRNFYLSINLDAIEELEKQLKNVEEERKLAKEGPVEALER